MSEEEGHYQVRESVERTAIPPFVAPTGYIPNELQPSQSSGVAGSSGLSVPHDCGAAPKLTRVWAMPSHNTFDVSPIGGFVKKYLLRSRVSVDPFARNKRWATYTNDINPNTAAERHLEADAFLRTLADEGVKADLLLSDPPYSPRQLKECYNSFGREMQLEDGQTARLRKIWRDAALPILTDDAVVLSFGWNTVGMGTKNGFEIAEVLLCCHGADHNDTICMAEIRRERDAELFPRELMQREKGSLCAT